MSVLGSSKVKLAVIILTVLLASVAVSFFTVIAVVGKRDIIFPGVRVADIELGGLSSDEAMTRLMEYNKQLGDKTITVIHANCSGQFKFKDIGCLINAEELVKRARLLGRQGFLLDQWLERRKLAVEGQEISLTVTADKKKLQQVLDEITKAVRVPPRDARLLVNPDDTVQIVESADGYGVDMEAAWNKLLDIAFNRDEAELPVKLVSVRPARTTENIRAMGINGVVAQFTTRFDLRKTNRVYNIKVAAQALDGQEVKPGQVFSFNKIVGPRSQEAGYKLAPTILNNEFIDSLGGGVCQVSTTLYNSLLLADVEIIERSSHSLVVSYVPLGQDAAVSYGGKDLRFKNNYDTSLLIKTKVVGNTITFKLFGDVKNKKYVKITNSTIKEYPYKIVTKDDLTLPKGSQTVKQKGVKGYKVVSQRQVYSGGLLIKKEKLPASLYNPLDQLILKGPGKTNASGKPQPRTVAPDDPPAPPANDDPPPVEPPVELPAEQPNEPPNEPGVAPGTGSPIEPPPVGDLTPGSGQ